MFRKILIANRGEIAIRAIRAAHELGANTVAVYPPEDHNSAHRAKADESYEIHGEAGRPVRAYLNIDEIIRIAKASGADAIYPGYGFLSENPDLARAARDNGITFIGPTPEALELAGDKVNAKHAANTAGVPTLRSTEATTDLESLVSQADAIGFPLFVKAVAGGGGRGMRRISDPAELLPALKQASSEAAEAFGDGAMFLEQAVLRPRHIEVQVLADAAGAAVHLFERDCSIQRRNQKVVEIAPAPNISQELRDRLTGDALKFAHQINYVNAGTVEFLVDTVGDRAGEHVFIEMNPRVQVEHTVSEQITGVDIVKSQMRIAAGATLAELGITQDAITCTGCAIQTRVTTEDPTANFMPDTGTITGFQQPGGDGVRIDGATAAVGAEISPYFDSLLAKLICSAEDFPATVDRTLRALREFHITGVKTNIPFLENVLAAPDFRSGDLSTQFIDETPSLLDAPQAEDAGGKLLKFLAEVTVNQPNGPRPAHLITPQEKLPAADLTEPAPAGPLQQLRELGPAGFAAALRADTALRVTDTSFRDAHQSLLATRVRTKDLLDIAPYEARMLPQLWSVEAWGGATYDVCLRFLGEDPWERLDKLHAAMPNLPIQMLLRGRNTVGYIPYPQKVCDAFVQEAAASGCDIFRVFDSLNDINQMRPAIESVLATGTGVAEGALCYTGDLVDPAEDLYTLDYYLKLAEEIVQAGAHIIGIKDMSGQLRPEAARRLVTALRKEFDVPVHLHTHDTPGGQLATLLAAAEAGVDAVDVASAPMSGTTSQPPMAALVAALVNTERDTGLDLDAVTAFEPYWEAVRNVYVPFEKGLKAPTGRIYYHQIPGGQLTNLRAQAIALGMADQFEKIEDMYAAANLILGRPTKVTPSSKVVGDLAIMMAAKDIDPADFEEHPEKYDVPDSVVNFMAGQLGDLPGGWPEPFRSKVLQGRHVDLSITPITAESEAALDGDSATRREELNTLLLAEPTKIYHRGIEEYGDLSAVRTDDYFYGLQAGVEHDTELAPGQRVYTALAAIGEPDENGERVVFGRLNGEIRPVTVRDTSVKVETAAAEKANPDDPAQIASPFSGVVTIKVKVGDEVEAGQPVASIEAMKMEANINTNVTGKVVRTVFSAPTQTSAGDLLVVIEPSK
jgi:pyruvate carboxylase